MIHIKEEPFDNSIWIKVPMEHVEEFKAAMQRACNTWQDISPEMDEFNQMLQHGRIIQQKIWEDDNPRALPEITVLTPAPDAPIFHLE